MPDAVSGVHGSQRQGFACCGLTRTEAAEDTLKAFLELAGQGESVGTTLLAQVLDVTPPTSSAMVKRLVAHGLVHRGPGRGLSLTRHGLMHAEQIVRRSRLLETLLVRVLGVPWDEAAGEAELLEHAVSDRLLLRIDSALRHPTRDPHGDPIPQPEARHQEGWGQRLADAPVGTRFTVERIQHRDGAALRYLATLGVRPGVTLELVERSPFGGPLWVLVDGRAHALGGQLAELVHGSLVSTSSLPRADVMGGKRRQTVTARP